VGVENKQNAVQSLKYLFGEKGFTTEIAVSDLSPNLLAGLSEVIGDDKIAIDPFHVMQELNRAILKDLARYRVQLFTTERKDLAKLKYFITTLQKAPQKVEIAIAPLPSISPHHQNAQKCLQVTQSILGVYQLADPKRFFSILNKELDKMVDDSNLSIVSFGLSIQEKLPKKAVTQTAMMRMKLELLRKLKTLYRECGEPLKNQQYEYSKQKWTLFYQPERLTLKRVKILTQFLSKYPHLQCYRDLTLSVGSIYRLPNELVSSRLILDLPENPKWGPELQACLSTFKKWANAIIRFKKFFENHQGLPKRLRANMEYQNPKIKRIFRSGNNMKGLTRIQNEVQFNLGGEVRNFLKAI
jgi:hypothetical protein